jgi:hypothetical protein
MSNILVGKTIVEIKLADDEGAIKFILNDGESVIAICDADCCSYTWIEHVEMPALGLPAEVISICDLEMPDLGDIPDCDVVSYYGLKINTSKGELVIDYRNDSNGYYGGDLSWPNEYRNTGIYGQNESSVNWITVSDDI